MNELGYSWVHASAVREWAVRARGLSMATCLVCDTVRSRAVLTAAGCAVYADIETCAPHFSRVCVRYDVRHVKRMAVCLMYGVVRSRATYWGGVCDESLSRN